MKNPCTYILASKPNGILYVGVTSDLDNRMARHKQGLFEGFTKQYDVRLLVYYEMLESMEKAIDREKKLKNWQRAWKIRLILNTNPEWLDLYDEESCAILETPADLARNPGKNA